MKEALKRSGFTLTGLNLIDMRFKLLMSRDDASTSGYEKKTEI